MHTCLESNGNTDRKNEQADNKGGESSRGRVALIVHGKYDDGQDGSAKEFIEERRGICEIFSL